MNVQSRRLGWDFDLHSGLINCTGHGEITTIGGFIRELRLGKTKNDINHEISFENDFTQNCHTCNLEATVSKK